MQNYIYLINYYLKKQLLLQIKIFQNIKKILKISKKKNFNLKTISNQNGEIKILES